MLNDYFKNYVIYRPTSIVVMAAIFIKHSIKKINLGSVLDISSTKYCRRNGHSKIDTQITNKACNINKKTCKFLNLLTWDNNINKNLQIC